MANLKRCLLVMCLMVSMLTLVNVHLVHGQSIQYGKLTGKVLLPSGETLPGVAVVITSDALMTGKRTTVSTEKGVYVFLNLPVGKYKVSASLEGFKTVEQEDVTISAAGSVTLNLQMEIGTIEQKVTVTAVGSIVDVKTSTVDSKIDAEMLKKLPTSRDPFYDLSLTTPGMVDVGKDSSWLPSPTAYGGSSNENVFLVNGVNTTNPRAASWGSMVKVNYNTVEEVRVISLGSKAEYGSFSGVAIDVLTKSGSNKFHGNVGYYTMLGDPASNVPGKGDDLGGDWLYVNADDDIFTNSVKDMEFNFTVGGPLIKNKVWFYGGFDYLQANTHEPNFDVTKDYGGRYYDLKLTAEPFAKHRMWVAYHHENNQNDGTSWGSLNWDTNAIYSTKTTNHTLSAQWQWSLTDTTFFSAKFLGFWTDEDPTLPGNAPSNPAYINWWKAVPTDMAVNGSFHYVEAQESSRNTIQADVSHYADDFLGEHDIKFGVQYTTGRGNWFGGYFHGYANYAYLYRWTYNIQYMKDWYGDTGIKMYMRQPHRDPFLTVRTADSLGIFFDDQWTIGNRLTINLGLRYDRMTTKYGEGGKVYYQPESASMINDLRVKREREGSDNIFDFKTWSPRIGLTYMLTTDGKTVLRASYGRYYAPVNVENLGGTGPDADPLRTVNYQYTVPFIDNDGDGEVFGQDTVDATRLLHTTTPDSFYETISDPSWYLKVADDLKDQHTDQFTLSLERELFKDFSVTATYIYKQTKNIIVRWPINEVTGTDWDYTRVPFVTEYGETINLYGVIEKDWNGDGAIDGGDVQWVQDHGDFETRNMPDIDGKKARRLYQGFQFVMHKRYSNRWQMLASFLYSTSEGMAARSKRQDFFIEGPNIVGDAWLAGLNQTINSMDGPLPFTPKYEVKISGSYRVPSVEVDLGFRFRYASGRALWPLQSYPQIQPWGGEGIISTGGNFIVARDPNDPLYYPADSILDLHVGRSFSFGRYGSLNVRIDCFNLFNVGIVRNATWQYGDLGRVVGITNPSRKIRLSLLYEF